MLDICSLFSTLLADLDGIYDPAQYNDRLLLGLKGTVSEAELHILKQRMCERRMSKARRGEFAFRLPSGYVRLPSGEVGFDADEQACEVVRLIFRKFEELGTLNGFLRYLARNGIQLGIRVTQGPDKGTLEWRRANRQTLQNLLKNPIYAAAYVYGRRPTDPRRKKAGRPQTGRILAGQEEWDVLIKDQHPAYISWDQNEANAAKLKSNRARADEIGAVRYGPALLAGLVACGECGARMAVHYGGKGSRHTFWCILQKSSYGGELCQSLAGPVLDDFVSRHVLSALEPASLELSLDAARDLEREREDLTRLWQQRLERAAYEAEKAARQYRLVEPENRLVARSLEREWEKKLSAHQKLEEEYHRFLRQQPRVLSEEEWEAIRRLATNIPALWEAPTTTDADRK